MAENKNSKFMFKIQDIGLDLDNELYYGEIRGIRDMSAPGTSYVYASDRDSGGISSEA